MPAPCRRILCNLDGGLSCSLEPLDQRVGKNSERIESNRQLPHFYTQGRSVRPGVPNLADPRSGQTPGNRMACFMDQRYDDVEHQKKERSNTCQNDCADETHFQPLAWGASGCPAFSV